MPVDISFGFQRLFIAIVVPEHVRKEIARAQEHLKRESPPGTVRWPRPDQFHITLKFLGDVPVDQVEALKNSLTPICAASPALRLSACGIGFFPDVRNPRVIWAGARDDEGILAGLHRKIDEALRWLAPAERTEKFNGHITLGRFKPGHHAAIPKIMEQANVFRDRHFGDWQAGEIELVRSELSSTGAEHTAIATYPFKTS